MKKILLILTALLFSVSFSCFSQCNSCNKVVFVLDASNSMDSIDFHSAKKTIEKISKIILQKKDNSVGVVQYASYYDSIAYNFYNVTVPFTKNFATVSSFVRDYKYGDSTAPYGDSLIMDHLPGSLAEMRLDSIWNTGNELDLTTDSCKIYFFFFTDANGSISPSYCCTHLKNNYGFAPSALLGYGEYNWLKTTYKIKSSVLHSFPSFRPSYQNGFKSCGAIASVGGQNFNFIDTNLGDPEGWTTKPRLFYPSQPPNLYSFFREDSVIDKMIKNAGINFDLIVFDSVCFGDSTNLSSSVDLSTTSFFIWNFGDGNIDTTSLTPKHYYTTPGRFTVSLLYKYPTKSCVDTVTHEIIVFPSINSNYYFDTVCLGDSTTFIAQSTDTFQNIDWDFGNGSSSSSFPVSVQLYSSAGIYSTSLTLEKSSTCKDTSINIISVENINNYVVKSNDTLISLELAASYQWLSYNSRTGYSVLLIDTLRYYVPKTSGKYCVEIKKGVCIDTSWFYGVILTSLQEDLAPYNISFYPNPAINSLSIISDKKGDFSLFSVDGKQLLVNIRLQKKLTFIDVSNLSEGVYLFRIKTDEGDILTKKVIKQ